MEASHPPEGHHGNIRISIKHNLPGTSLDDVELGKTLGEVASGTKVEMFWSAYQYEVPPGLLTTVSQILAAKPQASVTILKTHAQNPEAPWRLTIQPNKKRGK